jgi:D-tyrosyl-tRNA(Tyr) deacylase
MSCRAIFSICVFNQVERWSHRCESNHTTFVLVFVIAVLQRVSRAAVTVDGGVVGQIGRGLLVLVGVAKGDGPTDIDFMTSKIRDLRIFGDERGRLNRSIVETGGAVLVVSQFTLLGDVRGGRRPGFSNAAPPDVARAVYDALVARLRHSGLPVETGVFQAHMDVELVNDGPVTLLLDSRPERGDGPRARPTQENS